MTGGGCFASTTEGSVSPFVCTISVGPFVAVFSIMGIRSRRAGLLSGNKQNIRRRTKKMDQTQLFGDVVVIVKVNENIHLMWSYFLKSALYSTALC